MIIFKQELVDMLTKWLDGSVTDCELASWARLVSGEVDLETEIMHHILYELNFIDMSNIDIGDYSLTKSEAQNFLNQLR